MHIRWFHTDQSNQPEGYERMGGLFRLRKHRYLDGIQRNKEGQDLYDATAPLRWRKVFINKSLVEDGIYYANVHVTVDRYNAEDLEEGLE
jgi:hypothetical protein